MTAASLEGWPDLSGLTLKPTLDTLHLWSQVVGKIRTMLTPWESHGWHLPLYVTSRGLDIGLITGATLALSIDFELISEALVIRTTDGRQVDIELAPRSVASFYAEALAALARVGVEVAIDPMPNEIPDALPFHRDKLVWAYDGEMAHAYWSTLVQVRRVVQRFRTRFVGRSSPIHLFWGSLDLAVTHFSGRVASRHPGVSIHLPDTVTRKAYSQEVPSAGFWPGGGALSGPAFYSYAYSAPEGYHQARVAPSRARFDPVLGECLLSYADMFADHDWDAFLLAFLQSTYEAATDLGHWDRPALERVEGSLGHPPAI